MSSLYSRSTPECIPEKCELKSEPLELFMDEHELSASIDKDVEKVCEVMEVICLEPYNQEWKEFFEQYNSTDGIQVLFCVLRIVPIAVNLKSRTILRNSRKYPFAL